MLETRPNDSESHTTETLRDHLQRVMEEWRISPVGITTDNASNISKAIKLLQNLDEDQKAVQYETFLPDDPELSADISPSDDDARADSGKIEIDHTLLSAILPVVHIRCFAHTLNLATQAALKLQSVSLNNMRIIVKYFCKSTLAGEF